MQVVEAPDPSPGSDEVVIRITSIGMNHAELMQREGHYKATSGEPPFVPGLEGGGVIEKVGSAVTQRRVGQRVSIGLGGPRRKPGGQGTYQSHYVTHWSETVVAPAGIPDEILGAMWLPFMTAWGCLAHRQKLRAGQTVLIPAASSSVGLAAAQVVKELGGIAIGTTTSPEKVDLMRKLPGAGSFDHLIVTRGSDWPKQVKQITAGKGIDVAFDPVAAGEFLNTEIRLLAGGGTIWVYGLLGAPGTVDVSPLILKRASIRGWVLTELTEEPEALERGYEHIMARLADGRYTLPIAATFNLRDVRRAHAEIEKGKHVGKMVLVP